MQHGAAYRGAMGDSVAGKTVNRYYPSDGEGEIDDGGTGLAQVWNITASCSSSTR